MNSIGRFSTGIANIAFTKVVTVPAGQTVKLPIKINVNNTAGVASELKISLLEVKSDTALAGSFPMVGNAFTIASVDLGEINVKPSGDAPIASLNAGDKDVRLGKFDFEVRSEAQTIKRIVFTQDGTVTDTDLANLKLVDEDGTVLALGEMNRGELAFELNKECASGTTARLTIRGDVVGGAGRTIRFSIDNVNNVQSIGKIYNTTIVASGTTEDVNELKIERGAFILTKTASSPAASTVASTLDDQKFAAFKIEAIGEPIQLETVVVAVKTDKIELGKDTQGNNIEGTAVREIKLVNNGVVVASQEVKQGDFEKKIKVNDSNVEGKYVDKVELPLSEVVTVEPNSPITLDVLVDLKDAAEETTYEVGIFKIDASGLVSEKEIFFNKAGSTEEVTYGSRMRVGDVKVTLEQKAQVDGYVFQNQSEEVLAEFNIKHNLGETVRLSALKVKIANGDDVGAGKDLVARTFKNIKLVSSSGTIVSETIVNPTSDELLIPLKEGVTIESGKTIRLGLMADIRAGAQPGSKFKFAAIDASAVTTATGTSVKANKGDVAINNDIKESRKITIEQGVTSGQVKAEKTNEVLKDKNVVAGTNNVEIARWKLTNSSREAVGINKVYLTADYDGQTVKVDGVDEYKPLQRAYVQCVLKDNKETVLTDTAEMFTLNKGGQATEIDILKDGDKSKLVIDAANDNGDSEKELILYASVAEGAQIGGDIKVSLGRKNTDNSVDLFEITGRVSGMTSNCILQAGEGIDTIPSDNTTTVAVSVVNANAISGDRNIIENDYEGEGKGVKNETVGKFSIKNNGKTAVGLNQIVLRLDDQSVYAGIEKLELYDKKGNKVNLKDVVGEDENLEGVEDPNGGTISKWLGIQSEENAGDGSTLEKAHNYVIFNIADEIKIASGKEEVFEVRTESGELLPTGSKITLFVDKARTYTDKASLDGYKICLDNDDDVNLGKVEIKTKN